MITAMQQRFVEAYLSDPRRNARQAAIRAGYGSRNATSTASDLLANPQIHDAIEEELTRHLRHRQVDVELIVNGILDLIDTARRAGSGSWQANVQLKAYELLGRYLGMFRDPVDDVRLHEQRLAALEMGRKRALGLVPKEAKAKAEAKPVTEQDASQVLDSLKVDDKSKLN